MKAEMKKNSFRFLLSCALIAVVLPFALANVKYPKTASCPIDGNTAKASGKPKPTLDPNCVLVKYQHKGTSYADKLHPQRFNHEFSVSVCGDINSPSLSPAK